MTDECLVCGKNLWGEGYRNISYGGIILHDDCVERVVKEYVKKEYPNMVCCGKYFVGWTSIREHIDWHITLVIGMP